MSFKWNVPTTLAKIANVKKSRGAYNVCPLIEIKLMFIPSCSTIALIAKAFGSLKF